MNASVKFIVKLLPLIEYVPFASQAKQDVCPGKLYPVLTTVKVIPLVNLTSSGPQAKNERGGEFVIVGDFHVPTRGLVVAGLVGVAETSDEEALSPAAVTAVTTK